MAPHSVIIRPILPQDKDEWLRMRRALWPDQEISEMHQEMADILSDENQPVFVAVRPDGRLAGFLEASVHTDTYGCDTRPVGYIEGWFVDTDLRMQGIGALLVQAAEAWTLEKGFAEIASDCEIDNQTSLKAHLALGYEEVERLIHFRKRLRS